MQATELLKIAVKKLEDVGIASAMLDARVLLQFATQKPKEYFLAHPNAEVEEEFFLQLLEHRLKREPISHITGKKEFYGREFEVNSHVLTPRPDTELIIDTAKEYFKTSEKLNILELGVGSGCIILTLLAEFPNSGGLGVDISHNALAIAKKNAYNLGVTSIEFCCSDWTKEIKPQKVDLVISNPPYIKVTEEKNLEAELGFEPKIALYAGNSGLDAYQQIARELKSLDFSYAMFEIGQGQEAQVEEIFLENGMNLITTKKDLAGIIRVLVFEKK